MKKMYYTLCIFFCCMYSISTTVHAAEAQTGQNNTFQGASIDDTMIDKPATPYKVVLNQQNARVFAQSKNHVLASNNGKVLRIVLPYKATDVQFTLPAVNGKSQGTILGWHATTDEAFPPQGTVQKQSQALESMVDVTAAALDASHTKYEALKEKYLKLSEENKQQEMSITLGELTVAASENSARNRAWQDAKQLVQKFQGKSLMSQTFTVLLDTPLADKSVVHVQYAYTLNESRWTPSYSINADTTNDTIRLQLQAEIVQNSDMDWDDTQIEFSTVEGNAPSPGSVQPWIAGGNDARPLMRNKATPMASMDVAVMSNGMASFNEMDASASWTLNKKLHIPEGKSTIILLEESAKLPLQRLARPNTGTRDVETVWLYAEYALKNTFLPKGRAQYLLDAVPVSDGFFQPKNQKVALFFGSDSLVTIQTKKDVRKSAEAGIIQKEQIFSWNWTYTIQNQRKKPVSVRIEEPQVQLAHEDISVIYNDKPKASQGPDKTLIWTVQVPAQGKETIQRSVTIKAPEKLQFYPGR